MPQLNPAPWFFILLISWLTFSFILQPKILLFTPTNPPSNKTLPITKTSPWNWPWT
uniref:ATP synthase complex subunit 8 n=1 Tax=Tyrannus dominicensis TaxID=200370 RepID=Q8LU29_TYRDO|nr:ATPase subunit 8 [Tyrannus dominicensis]AAM98617.1 ATPase subunit 8 [Tyrannus dominicensis]AAM98619.1 ATPase subunit 8 [Tyrannus dominicensis]AAM98621.1 ATPase subunit 8 [Tyrannus dominicensis]AAM98623.1 ATPase subunit 8 [Tyrannus dominicensis]